MGWFSDRLQDFGDFLFHGGLEDDIKELGRSIDDSVHSLGRRVEDTIKGFAKQIEEDPLKAAASALAIASGQWWALPAVNAVDALIAGADIEDAAKIAAKTAAKQYIVQQITGYVGESDTVRQFGQDISNLLDVQNVPGGVDSWSEWADYAETAIPAEDIIAFANLGSNGLTAAAQTVVSGVAGAAAAGVNALIEKKDIPSALLQSVTNTALRTALNSGLSNQSIRYAPDFVKRALATAGAAGVLGESMSQAGAGSLLNDAMIYVKDQLSQKYKAFTEETSRKLSVPTQSGAVQGYDVVDSKSYKDPMSQATTSLNALNFWIARAQVNYNRYDYHFNNIGVYREELINNYKLLTDPALFAAARADPNHPLHVYSYPWRTDPNTAKSQILSAYQNAETGLRSSTDYVNEFQSTYWPQLTANIEAARQTFATDVANATNIDAQLAAEALSTMQTYEQIANTVALAQGVDVSKADRVQIRGLMEQDKPLEAAYNYAVKTNPNFLTESIKKYESAVAAGKTPDYNAMDLLVRDLSKYDDVKRINPDFNAEDYKKLNQLNVSNPYEHYLTQGKDQGLMGSQVEANWRTSLEKSRLLGEAAQLIGVGVNELSPETRQALSTAIDQKFADPRDFKEMAETSLRNWDDVAGLKLAPARLATLKSGEGMQIDVSGAGIKAVESFEFGPDDKLAAMGYRRQADIDADIAKGNAELQKYFGKSITDKVRIGTTDDMARGVGKFIEIPDTNTRAYVVAVAPDADLDAVPSDNLARLDALANAPVSYFDGDAQLRDYFKGIVDKAKGAALNTPAVQLLQFAGNAIETLVPDTAKGVGMKAAANVIQSFNGLVTLAGINPSSTPVGKFAEQLMELGKAKTSDEYRAAVAAMEKNYGDAKGAWGAAKAIWGNLTNYPTEFLSEVVISEGLQEIVPLLIGGGATVAARGLALARGMGTKLAQQMGARAGLAAGAVSDIAESVGGSAGNAFEEAYDIAKNKMGKSEAEATEIALGVAARSGLISGMVTGLSLGMGGGALEKAFLGKTGSGNLASTIEEVGRRMKDGVKIVGKEGASESIEEGLTSGYTESQLYALDPTRDVGANIATSMILGGIAGGGIAGSAYGAGASRDIIANALAINPQVQQTIQSAPNIAEAQKALGDLGISNAAVQTDLLNNKFDGQIVSSNEAYSALRNNTGYTPTNADVAALSGVRPEANLQNDALQYIDPRMVDEAEVRQAMQALGYSSPTNEEVAQYLGQRNEASTLGDINQTFDPKAVDAGEAEAALRAAGYTPTAADIASFTGVKPEANLAGDVQRFVDPRQVTEAEVRKAFEDLGYTPTKEEIAQYVRAPGANISQTDIEKQIGAYADPKAVDKAEAKAALEAAGLKNPTEAEINRLIGQYPEADLAAKTKDLSDTLQIERTAKEVADIQAKIGAPNTVPTAADVTAASRMAVSASRKAGSPGFNKDYDVNGDGVITPSDALTLLKMSQGIDVGPIPKGLKWEAPTGLYKRMFDVEMAVKNIKFPDTLSEEDVRNIVDDAFDKNPGLSESDVTRVVNDALIKLPAAPTKQDITDAVNAGIGSRSVLDDPKTPQNEAKAATGIYREIEQIEAAISNIKFPPTLTEQQVKQIVATAFEENPGLTSKDVTDAIEAALDKVPASPTLDQINTAIGTQIGSRSVKDNPNTPQNESQEATGIYREIERLEGAIAGIKFPETLSDEQVREIVQGVFDKNPGLTGADVNSAIDAALSKLPAAPTLDEINRAITSQVGSPAIADDPKTAQNEAKDPTGIYREIKRIDDALANLEFPPTLSDEQVREIVRGVFKENPGLTNADVSRAIDTALTKLPTAPTLNEINRAISSQIGTRSIKDDPKTAQDESKEATGLYRDIEQLEFALNNIDFPPSLTEAQVKQIVQGAFDANPGLSDQDVTNAIDAALNKLPAAPTLEEINTAVAGQIGARSVKDNPSTPQDESKEATGIYREIERIEQAIEGIEIPPSLTEQQVKDIVAGVFEENPGLSPEDVKGIVNTALDALPVAPTLAEISQEVDGIVGAPSVKDDPTTPENEAREATGVYRAIEATAAGVESRLGAAIADAKAAGLEGDAALDAAIKKVALQLGTSETTLLAKIGKTAQDLSRDFAAQLETVTGQITTVEQAIGKPASVDANGNPVAATGLYAEIAKNEAAGMTREAATQKAIAALSKQLGASETAIKNALAVTESTLGGRITTVEQAIGAPESVDANGNKIPATGIFAEIAKNEAAGMTRDAATQKAIVDLSKQLGASETAVKAALTATETALGGRITTVEQAIGAPASVDANGNKIPATGIFAEIAKNEAAGMSRDAATQKAISDLSKQIGASETSIKAALATTESTLGGRITTVEQAIGAPASVGADGKPVAATGIFAEIAKNEAAGMSRDAAIQKAITDLSGQLGIAQEKILGELSKAETRFGTALAGVQTAVTGQIAAAQNQIMERMAVYEQAGIDRDTALNLAIQDVSSKLGGQITDLSQLVGKPTSMATQGDIDAINQMIAGTKPMDLSYDITGDKTVDAKDIDALQRWLAATDTEQFPPGSEPQPPGSRPVRPFMPDDLQIDRESRWAPTGLYGELADATRAQQAAAKAQTEQVLRGQRQANVMQMLGLIAQEPAGGAQQVTVKAADPAKIGYIYDWSSIFANPQQQQMFASPFAEGGEVADTDELIAILRGSHG